MTTRQRTAMLTLLPHELVASYIFPFLSGDFRDLRALDTAYTNKLHRSRFRSIWALCEYDCIERKIKSSAVEWLLHAGVRIISMRVLELKNIASLDPILNTLRRLHIEECVNNV